MITRTSAMVAIAAGAIAFTARPAAANVPTTAVHCGDVLTHSVKLAADLTNCPADGLAARPGRQAQVDAAAAHAFSPVPRIAYASYWGASGHEGCGSTPGADGSLYVTCGTDSPDLPRVGAIQSYQGAGDVYIAKLDRTGKHIIYATYLGSPGPDDVSSVAVDARGHVFVSGIAAAGFPTTAGAFDTTFNGAAECCEGAFGDVFVAELSADGSRLMYSTFVGGTGGPPECARVGRRRQRRAHRRHRLAGLPHHARRGPVGVRWREGAL
jgi:hypothetical protein